MEFFLGLVPLLLYIFFCNFLINIKNRKAYYAFRLLVGILTFIATAIILFVFTKHNITQYILFSFIYSILFIILNIVISSTYLRANE